jgi:hypothetical protein
MKYEPCAYLHAHPTKEKCVDFLQPSNGAISLPLQNKQTLFFIALTEQHIDLYLFRFYSPGRDSRAEKFAVTIKRNNGERSLKVTPFFAHPRLQ